MQFEKSSGLSVDHGHISTMQNSAQRVSDSYKHLLESMVKSGSKTDPLTGTPWVPSYTILEEVRKQFELLEADLKIQYQTNQHIMGNHTQFVINCNVDRQNAFSGAGGVVALKNTMQTARDDHTTCRNEEDDEIDDMEARCDEFKNSTRCEPKDSSDQNWFASTNMSTYQPSPWNTLRATIDKAKECRTEVLNVTETAQRCDGLQQAFEEAFCKYEKKLTDTCSEHSECYEQAKSNKDQAQGTISELEKEQKLMFRMIQRVHCYLDLLFKAEGVGGNNAQMPGQSDITACNGITANTLNTTYTGDSSFENGYNTTHDSVLDIDYGVTQAKDLCYSNPDNADDADVFDYESEEYEVGSYNPSQASWKKSEYEDLSDLTEHGKINAVDRKSVV